MSTAASSAAVDPAAAPAAAGGALSQAALRRAMNLNIVAGCMGISWYVVCAPGNLLNVFFKNHLGATPFQLGLLTALMQTAAIFNLAGIAAFRVFSRRRPFWLTTHIIQRSTGLIMAAAAIIVAHNGNKRLGILLILIASATGWIMTHSSSSGWWSWMADLIPENIRATFFGRRSSILNFSSMTWNFAASVLVDQCKGNAVFYAYAGIFAATTIFGVLDILLFLWIPEPEAKQAGTPEDRALGLRHFLEPLRQRNFLGFCMAVGLFGLSVSVAGPFIAPYITDPQGINAPMTWLAVMAFITQMACIITATSWGLMMDRFGRKPAVLLGALFPFTWLTFLFLSPSNLIFLLPLQALAAGVIISGWNDGVNQLMLTLTPDKNRTAYIAWYIAIAGLIAALGSLGGGWLYQLLKDVRFDLPYLPAITSFHIVILVALLLCTFSIFILGRIREGNTRPLGFILSRLATPGVFRTFLNLNTLVGTADSVTVVRALRTMDDGSDELLIKDIITRLDDPDADVRLEAVRALGRIRSHEAVNTLIERICDVNSPIRSESARALGKIGDTRAIPFLISALEKSGSEEFQEACVQALGVLGGPDSAQRLFKLLQEPRPERVIVSGVEAISKLGTLEAAWEILPRMHKTDNPVLRKQLAIAMGNTLGGPGEFYQYITGDSQQQANAQSKLFGEAKSRVADILAVQRRTRRNSEAAAEQVEHLLQRLTTLLEADLYREAIRELHGVYRILVELLAVSDRKQEHPDEILMECAFLHDSKLGIGFWAVTEIKHRLDAIASPDMLRLDALLMLYFLSRFEPEADGK